MLDDVGIQGVRPVGDHPSKRGNRQTGKPGKTKKNEPKKKDRRKKAPPPADGGIDIVI